MEAPAAFASTIPHTAGRLSWGSRRYGRNMYGTLQLICHQYVAGCILWEAAPFRCRRHAGDQKPCAMKSYTRIACKARRKLREPWPKRRACSHLHDRKKTANNPCNPIWLVSMTSKALNVWDTHQYLHPARMTSRLTSRLLQRGVTPCPQ